MKNINWKVRIKNKVFWCMLIPALLVLIQYVLAIFGISFDFSKLQDQLLKIIDAIFVVLSILGVVVDPTTSGIKDSKQAMTYISPKED